MEDLSPISENEFSPREVFGGNVEGQSDELEEKKRRLKPEQVRALEEVYEVETMLGPHRKQLLADELGLHPRQVAIWFQNRRARCKSSLLEKEYDTLRAQYEKLNSDHVAIFAENQKLRNQVHRLTQKLLGNRQEGGPIFPDTPPPATSVKSDVINSEGSSPLCLKPDFSDEEGMPFQQPLLTREELQPNSCNLGFPVQHQGTWLWRF